jgi:hypothetical protein
VRAVFRHKDDVAKDSEIARSFACGSRRATKSDDLRPGLAPSLPQMAHLRCRDFNVLAMGLNPSPSGETLRFCVLLESGDGEVSHEFA